LSYELHSELFEILAKFSREFYLQQSANAKLLATILI